MAKFYFTFGSSEQFPFKRGEYVVVEADNYLSAQRLFMAVYPNPTDKDTVNCADTYTKEQWDKLCAHHYKGVEPAEILAAYKRHVEELTYLRMSEIAEKSISGMYEAEPIECMEFCDDELDMSYAEKNYFCLNKNGEEEEAV